MSFASGDFPSETVTLSFAKIEYDYRGMQPNGSCRGQAGVLVELSRVHASQVSRSVIFLTARASVVKIGLDNAVLKNVDWLCRAGGVSCTP